LKSLFNLWINVFLNQILDQANGIVSVALAMEASSMINLESKVPFHQHLSCKGLILEQTHMPHTKRSSCKFLI